MRIWAIPYKYLCREHLLGLHRELHAMIMSLIKGKDHLILGHIKRNQIDVRLIISKHDECVQEMQRRKYNHKSPFPEDSQAYVDAFIAKHGVTGIIDYDFDLKDLSDRCIECRILQQNMEE